VQFRGAPYYDVAEKGGIHARIRNHDDFIPRADAERAQGELERFGTTRNGHRVLHADVAGELRFEVGYLLSRMYQPLAATRSNAARTVGPSDAAARLRSFRGIRMA
jgi:hypothetical protein